MLNAALFDFSVHSYCKFFQKILLMYYCVVFLCTISK